MAARDSGVKAAEARNCSMFEFSDRVAKNENAPQIPRKH